MNHGSQAKKELKEKQAQFNILHVMKPLMAESPVKSVVQWVEGHLAKKDSDAAHIRKGMTDLVDRLADIPYHISIQLQNFIGSNFPFEKFRLKPNGKKVTGNLCREMDILTEE